jgi:hypothetical protein
MSIWVNIVVKPNQQQNEMLKQQKKVNPQDVYDGFGYKKQRSLMDNYKDLEKR